jgi:hypothetical protein
MPTFFEDEPLCEICGGKGVIDIDDLHVQLCVCGKRRMFRTHLGPEILAAENVKSSPFYVLGAVRRRPSVDLTKQNMFVKSSWRTLLPHLKWTLFYKGLNFRFRIVTDERILNVRLGKESAILKSRSEREDGKHQFYDSLYDLLEDPDLVIVRLGKLGHKNIAAAGYLKEALMIREVNNKPTWLVEEPDNPYTAVMIDGTLQGNYSYSEETAGYIHDHFEEFDLTTGDDKEYVSSPVTVMQSGESDPITGSIEEEPDMMVTSDEDEVVSSDLSVEESLMVLEHKPKKTKYGRRNSPNKKWRH